MTQDLQRALEIYDTFDSDHDDASLFTELGESAMMGSQQSMPIGPSARSTMISGDAAWHRQLGRRLFAKTEEQLFDLLCGDDDQSTQDRAFLLEVLKLEREELKLALVGFLVASFNVAPAVATVLAALLFRRVIAPGLAAACDTWAENRFQV